MKKLNELLRERQICKGLLKREESSIFNSQGKQVKMKKLTTTLNTIERSIVKELDSK